jgi:hypothetical protein
MALGLFESRILRATGMVQSGRQFLGVKSARIGRDDVLREPCERYFVIRSTSYFLFENHHLPVPIISLIGITRSDRFRFFSTAVKRLLGSLIS